ncbi:MAG: SGNH/GDSL hydrolase family protein [Actinomycetota bacterium]
MQYNRFIALGDSMTEGMSDEVIGGRYRGWADRVAEVATANWDGFTYANLAIRGKLVGQVVNEQIPKAKKLIEGKSTLVSFHAGANDVIRPKYDPMRTIATYNHGVDELARSGATLMLFCVLEDSGATTRAAQVWKERFKVFNENVRRRAAAVDAILFDPNHDDFWRDERFIHEDRLHLNSEGHRRVAQAVLSRLELPHDKDWRTPLPKAEPITTLEKIQIDLYWFGKYALTWMGRWIRGRSSGDGRDAKYPTPITFEARS